jgi:hypothetical protein
MSVSGVTSGYPGIFATGGAKSQPNKGQDAIDAFLKISQQTPAEQLQEQWLKAHGLTKEKLAAMTPEQRDTVIKQMSEDIKQQMKDAAMKQNEKKDPTKTVDILA